MKSSFDDTRAALHRRVNRVFAGLLVAQLAFAILVALTTTPWWRLLEHAVPLAITDVVLLVAAHRWIAAVSRVASRELHHTARLEHEARLHTVQLQTSLERYRVIVEKTAAVPFELTLPSRELAYIAPQAATLFGCLVDELSDAELITTSIHPEDRHRVFAALDASAAGTRNSGDPIEYRIRRRNNQVVYVSTFLTSDGNCIRGITIDVTRQRKLELELAQAQKLESVGRLAAGVAHEINTPIQFVSDSVQFVRDTVGDLVDVIGKQRAVLDRIDADDPMASEARASAEAADLPYLTDNIPRALERAVDGLERVTTIVRSMKSFAHPGAEMKEVDLNAAVESTLTVARNEYRYVADLVKDLGELPRVMCNVGEINQVILNLVVNAAHAIGDLVAGSRGAERGTLTVRTRHDDGFVTVEVSDTGAGIPRGIRSRIFEPFFTTKPVGTGSGQGLALSRAVVDKHGGWLTFESTQGQGTTFTMCIPVVGRRPNVRESDQHLELRRAA